MPTKKEKKKANRSIAMIDCHGGGREYAICTRSYNGTKVDAISIRHDVYVDLDYVYRLSRKTKEKKALQSAMAMVMEINGTF